MGLKSTAKRILRPAYYRLPARICYGASYIETLKLLETSKRWTGEQHLDYQLGALRKILIHASVNVPYYRRLFRAAGFDPQSVRRVEDLRAVPFLDKETVLANPADFLAENIPKAHRLYYTTGGTMGRPMGIFNLKGAPGRERAFIYNMWRRAGFSPGDKRAMLRGWPAKRKRHWRYDAAEKGIILSNFHMTPDNVSLYAAVIKNKQLAFLHSYPSAIIDFARHLKDLGISPPRFKAILAASENLYPGQREFIESFYGSRLFSWYGHTENVILAGECEVSSHYHIYSEYGVAELVKQDGSEAVNEGDRGELVGTSLYNYAMPLIRYRTEDWAVAGPRRCDCGRNYRLLSETHGRWRQEMLVGSLDNLISVTALNVHSDVFDQVHQMQFYQREKGKVELRIKPKTNFSNRDAKRIIAELDEKMGDTMKTSICIVDEISLMPRGKFRLVVREIDLPGPSPREVAV